METAYGKFAIPTFRSMGLGSDDKEVTYFSGNSLGLMPKATKCNVIAELDAWADNGVMGHQSRTDGKDPWAINDRSVEERLAKLILGCETEEVAYNGTLTSNLNSLVQAFYRPTSTRFKLLCEAKAFPSDLYCFQNQVRLHGFEVDKAFIRLEPEEGSDVLTTRQILEAIEFHGEELALVCLPGIQYYTGQYFDIPTITMAAKKAGAVAGWDLAHAAGNVPLKLHEWGVDFAVFCSYKYLNCGPGNLGGLFVHADTAKKWQDKPRPAGWWGVELNKRFDMEPVFIPAPGAHGFAQSNVNLFGPACMHASLDLFEAAGGVSGLAERRKSLTGKLDELLHASKHYGKRFRIMTDSLSPDERGSQLSLLFMNNMLEINDALVKRGIIGDERKPGVIRLAPVPLYNTHAEVEYAAKSLEEILDKLYN